MSDKIKTNITTSYMLFVFNFADLMNVDKKKIESGLPCPISDVFSSQKRIDTSKRNLGKQEFNELLALYFSQFQTQDGFDFHRLDGELTKNKKVFLRHLGKDKINYLSLLVTLMKTMSEKRRGLLAGAAS